MSSAPPPPANATPPPPAPPAGPVGASVADLRRRAVARLIDTVLVGVVVTVTGFVLVWPQMTAIVEEVGDDPAAIQAAIQRSADGGALANMELATTILVIGISIGLYLLCDPLFGGTPGKKLTGLVVVGADGERPSSLAAVVRNAWLLLWAIPALGLWLVVFASIAVGRSIARAPDGRGLHDRIAGTAVLRR